MPLQLPLPVAVLVRRARNAKSPKDRHDTAWHAWEASLRLAVAIRPPADPAPLARPSAGHWASAVAADSRPRDAPALIATYRLLCEVGRDERVSPRSVAPRALLDALPAYRNRVLGHGGVRDAAFYAESGRTLLEGLEAAWDEELFLPGAARLVFVEAVEIDASGARRARVLDLGGENPTVADPAGVTGVPADLLPGRVYAREDGTYRPLHPWVLFQEAQLRERVLFFNGLKRTPEYLDFASGEVLAGRDLEAAFPGVTAEMSALFHLEGRPVPAPAPTEADDPGLLGGFRLLGKLGEGGMGIVYLARQESLDRLVALKVLPPGLADDATAVARFEREVSALSRCDHPNVVKVLAAGRARGTLYYAMEFIDGADLAQVARELGGTDDVESAVSTAAERLRRGRAELLAGLPAIPERSPRAPTAPAREDRYRELAVLFRDAARGLHHLHGQGILHRDVKPGNLMVTAEDRRVVVMDLGLAAVADASRTLTRDATSLLGTLRYMPPEQLQRNLLQVDRRADVYALGATFYELLTGRPLFDGDSEARLIQQVLRESPLPPRKADPRIPMDLATILTKATEKDPALRYDTAEALAQDLDAYLERRPIAARPPTLSYVFGLAVRRNKPLAATIAVAMLVLVAGGTFAYLRERVLRDQAGVARQMAELRQYRAQSQGLAAASQEARSGAPSRALLLAREAYRHDAVAAAEQSLRDALVISLERGVLYGHEAEVRSAAFSSDGSRILTVSDDKTARLWDRDGKELAVLRGHEAEVVSAAFSPDGSRIVTASQDKTVRLWDREGTELAVLRSHEAEVWSAAFSPDGSLVVTASADRTARLFDREGKALAVLRGHEDAVRSAAFSPDGSRIVTASDDKTARLWDRDGKELAVLRSHEAAVGSAVFSPDSSRIVTASRDKVARVWDRKGQELLVLRGHDGEVVSAAFSADGSRIVTASEDKTARLWDHEGKELAVLRGHEARVWSAAFSADGSRIVTASQDKTAHIWDREGKELAVLRGHEAEVWSGAFSPDGSRIVTASDDKTARLWDRDGKELGVLRGHEAWVWSAAFSADGRRIVTASWDRTARLWDREGKEGAVLRGHEGEVMSAAFSADGSRIVTASWDKTARLWDREGKEVAVLRGHKLEVRSAAFSPDGGRILTASYDKTARLWDREGKELAVLNGHEARVWTAAFSPDGSRIVTASWDKTARLWDREGKELAVLRGHDGRVYSAVFSPDGSRIVTASEDRTARLWDRGGKELAILRGHKSSLFCAAFSPDGSRIVTASWDKAPRLWDREGRELTVLRGHEAPVRSAAFSPDGSRIVTASEDKTARLWTGEGKELAVLRGHEARVWSAVFSPDGNWIVSTSEDRKARIWPVHVNDLLRLANARLSRDFTAQEVERYRDLLSETSIARAAATWPKPAAVPAPGATR